MAKGLAYDLERETGVQIDRLPYTLDIPSYLGSAKVDGRGSVLEETRNAHQWRRVKYSYMDCRREANRSGLTIRGPQKIFDSSLANIGMLYAKQNGVFRDSTIACSSVSGSANSTSRAPLPSPRS